MPAFSDALKNRDNKPDNNSPQSKFSSVVAAAKENSA